MSDTSATAPGFYPDPSGEPQLRWWNGQTWTADVRPPEAGGRPVQPPLADGVRVNTLWSWLLALTPLVGLISIFLVDWDSYMSASLSGDESATLSQLASPAYLFSSALGWIAFAANVLFAYLDWNALRKLGVVQPFHWAWGFLSIVYVIGRAVVVRRRTGRGLSPLFLYIALTVTVFVVTGIRLASAIAHALATTDLSSFGSVGGR